MRALWTEESYRLDPPLLLVYEEAPIPRGRRRSWLRHLRHGKAFRHWAGGLGCSVSGAAIAGGLFSLITGHSGWGLAGTLLAAGVVTTWLSSPTSGVGVSLAAWCVLFAMFLALGQVDPVAGLVVWALLVVGLVGAVRRALR